MKEASDRLRQLRIKRGFSTAADAAKAFGWNEHTYKSHENGIRGIKLEAARKYASALGTSAAYILTGGRSDLQTVNSVSHLHVVARVSAGTFRYDEPIDDGGFFVPFVPRGDIPAGAQYAVIIDGQSVNKRIPDGAFAICALYDSVPGGAQHGQLVHVVRERGDLHEHTIKELRFSREGMQLFPVSTDPRFQDPVQLSSGEDGEIVRIQGVVIGVFQAF